MSVKSEDSKDLFGSNSSQQSAADHEMEYAEETPCVDEEAGDEEYQEDPDVPLSQCSQSPSMTPESRMTFQKLLKQQIAAWLP